MAEEIGSCSGDSLRMLENRQSELPLFPAPAENRIERSGRLFLVPTTHGEVFDSQFAPEPSPLTELPEIERWTQFYLISVLEILAGRRPLHQIARNTHRFIYNSIAHQIGTIKELPKIRSIHRHQPIEGVIEMTTILIFKARARALVTRFEGVDRRWLCTELELL